MQTPTEPNSPAPGSPAPGNTASGSPAAPGRRATRKAATRAALLDVALALFAERGFDAVTVDAIADGAGVSRRTVFRYFPTKEALFFAPQEARLAQFTAQLEAAIAPHHGAVARWQAVERAVLAMAAVYEADKTEVLARHHVLNNARGLAAWDQQLDARWEAAIVAALMPGMGRERALVAAGALIGVVRAGLRAWLAAEGDFDLVAFGERAFAALRAGLPEA